MNKQSRDVGNGGAGSEKPTRKRPYRRPVLSKLGSLKDMTMNTSGGKTPDGKPGKVTGRGGRNGIDGR